MTSENPSPSDLEAALHSVVDDTADEVEASAESGEHLDAVRIHQLTKLRRATIRSRSWCVIAAVVAFFAAGELLWKSLWSGLTGLAWTAAGILCGVIGVIFVREVLKLHREIRRPITEARGHGFEVIVDQPPDFSTLSDGSQHYGNLEEMK